MKSSKKIDVIKEAKKVLRIESVAIDRLTDRIGREFVEAVDVILDTRGKVVVTGIGKSGLVGQKIASTMASTGTPAYYLHPSEGAHGDLGILGKEDIVIAISNSGESEEVLKIVPFVRRLGIKLIAIVGVRTSTLAKGADIVIHVPVEKEACPFGLAPTASTTAELAIGDAMAVTLLLRRGFTKDDFALFHPGGVIGKKLLTRIEDLMHTGTGMPSVYTDTKMKDVLVEITSKRMGLTGVYDRKDRLAGVITDGDLRRALEKYTNVLEKRASDIMTLNPKRIERHALAVKALNIMETFSITSLFVTENGDRDRPIGVVHLHDILKAGIV
ncbi:MAG: KpsF/GutQ family sugar-phosphate isomerase [Deltaproteobacteria bacterium]|nr:KpsF/GutQ family sugar-phosphate isomerase [Deltaproteobacteria bacterium]